MLLNPRDHGDIVIYQAPNGEARLEVRLTRETTWLSQRQMALLFEKDTDTVGLHIRKMYREGELKETATTEESSVFQDEGGRQIRRTGRAAPGPSGPGIQGEVVLN